VAACKPRSDPIFPIGGLAGSYSDDDGITPARSAELPMTLTSEPVAVRVTESPPQAVAPGSARGWTFGLRIVFRYAFFYLVLYIFPFPINTLDSLLTNLQEIVTGEEPSADEPSSISRYLTKPYKEFMDDAVLWTGREVFGVDIEYRPLGSGDTTWNYVQVFAFAIVVLAVTLLWTLTAWLWQRLRDRPTAGYPGLHEWLRVYVRFYLAETMIVYGSVKVIKLQFPYPGPDALLHTYGESSPMHLLWTFMGASDGYTFFAGAGELVGGILLCARRTTLLGALVTFGVMLNVAVLNFCYDVPVKLFSSHLLLMSLFLIAPDLPWLVRVFLLGRRDTPRGERPLVRRLWLDRTLLVVRTLVVLTFVGVTMHSAYESSALYGQRVAEPPLFGLWDVEEFALDGNVRPPLTTDADRWQRVTFNKALTIQKSKLANPRLVVTSMTGKAVLFAEALVDEEKHTMTLTVRASGAGSKVPAANVLRYQEVEPEVIELEGAVAFLGDGKSGTKHVKARLRHYGEDKFLLSNRGFHWINEVPYNRFSARTQPPPGLPPPPMQK
jgi:uncharacterized membrane protein YphA (DoxX/SURF4 family)